MRSREGDFVETIQGLIFDVKGLIHPPDRVISFLRYVPSPDGDRQRHGTRYRKIHDLDERWAFLREHYPDYIYFDDYFGRELQAVPKAKIRLLHDPRKKLNELLKGNCLEPIERDTVELAQILEKEAAIDVDNIGVSGSVLVGLHESSSDIDLIIYGKDSSRSIQETLERLLSTNKILRRYDVEGLKRLYRSRSMETAMGFSGFLAHERRKVLQGSFRDRDYFIRCLRDWDEVQETYGSFRCRRFGKAKIHAVVSEDSESIFTPCIYEVKDVTRLERAEYVPTRVISYRGRFCEQVKTGEEIMALGELENVVTDEKEYSQLVVGESPRDFIFKV